MARNPRSESAPRQGAGAGAARWTLLLPVTILAGLLLLWLSVSGPDLDDAVGEVASPEGATGAQQRAPGSNLPVTLSSCEERGDSVWAEGYVRNGGGVVVRYVEVEVTWRSAEGSLLDRRVTYAIGGEVFTPGDSISFRTATGELAAVSCEAILNNYEPL